MRSQDFSSLAQVFDTNPPIERIQSARLRSMVEYETKDEGIYWRAARLRRCMTRTTRTIRSSAPDIA